jgi:two-component system sensor histidine kinase GlrK
MKVATKLAGAFALFIVVLVALLGYHLRTIQHAVSTNYELSDLSSRVYLASTRQVARLGRLEENAGKFLVTRDPGYLEKFVEARDTFQAGLATLDSAALSEREREALERLSAVWTRFLDDADALGAPVRATDAALLPRLHGALDELRVNARALGDAAQAAMVARLDRSAEAARRAERISWGAVAGALLLGVLVSGVIVRSIADALRRLQEGTREVAAGNFAYRLEPRRDDEFAQLARDFNVMTRRLGELDQMKKDFLSKVSHDLKTPLASMRETTRALLDEVPGPLTERQQRLLELNDQSAARLSAMIGKILELSALEAGALSFETRPTDIVALAERALQEIAPSAGDHELAITAPAEPLLVLCDGERISRVLANLLENAVKFSPGGASIRLALEPLAVRPARVPPERWAPLDAEGASGAVLITVSDAGPGIPDAEKERIFERFFQAESGKRVHGRGVGLGLTICREIVDAHHGALWVDDAPGGGSTFSLLLPWTGASTLRQPVAVPGIPSPTVDA